MEITWATDGSPASNAALPWLKGPLNRRDHRITVVTAVPAPQQVTALFKIFRVSTSPPETVARVEIVARDAAVSSGRCRRRRASRSTATTSTR